MSVAEVSILAGGWSAQAYDLQALPGYVIGVNDAGLLARCDAVVSMDRLWTENRWAALSPLGRDAWIREAALKNIARPWPAWLRPFACDHTSSEMSLREGVLNGTNSGLCAVNLGFQLQPKLLRLYGMDLARGPNGERHWYPDYPWQTPGKGTSNGSFASWRADLDHALERCVRAGIDVLILDGKGVA